MQGTCIDVDDVDVLGFAKLSSAYACFPRTKNGKILRKDISPKIATEKSSR